MTENQEPQNVPAEPTAAPEQAQQAQPQPVAQPEQQAQPVDSAYAAQTPYQQQYNPAQGGQYVAPGTYYNPDDHTAQFDPADIAEHKIYAALTYIFGPLGIIIAALAAKGSAFARFHMKQAASLLFLETVILIAMSILFFTILVPIAGGIMLVVLTVIELIGTWQAVKGQAKDLPIVKSVLK
ncbi:MAG: hypothetical protein IJV62_00930 [Eggerthellaceae bacterium]|nr:hypothetical protein [Eggerthellaceae bacterium]